MPDNDPDIKPNMINHDRKSLIERQNTQKCRNFSTLGPNKTGEIKANYNRIGIRMV